VEGNCFYSGIPCTVFGLSTGIELGPDGDAAEVAPTMEAKYFTDLAVGVDVSFSKDVTEIVNNCFASNNVGVFFEFNDGEAQIGTVNDNTFFESVSGDIIFQTSVTDDDVPGEEIVIFGNGNDQAIPSSSTEIFGNVQATPSSSRGKGGRGKGKSKVSTTSKSSKAPTTSKSSKAPATSKSSKAHTTSKSSKVPATSKSSKAHTTSKSSKAPTTSKSSKAPATSKSGKAHTASKSVASVSCECPVNNAGFGNAAIESSKSKGSKKPKAYKKSSKKSKSSKSLFRLRG
jgi:hypothetical protein